MREETPNTTTVSKIGTPKFILLLKFISKQYNQIRSHNNASRRAQYGNSALFHTIFYFAWLTHWGRVTHICVGILTITGSDNCLSPGRRQAIIWTNAGILLMVPLGTNFSEILIEILTFSIKKMHLKMSSAKWLPFWLDLDGLTAGSIGPWLSGWLHRQYCCPYVETAIPVNMGRYTPRIIPVSLSETTIKKT